MLELLKAVRLSTVSMLQEGVALTAASEAAATLDKEYFRQNT